MAIVRDTAKARGHQAAAAASETHGQHTIHVSKPRGGDGKEYVLPPLQGLRFIASVRPWVTLAPQGLALSTAVILHAFGA